MHCMLSTTQCILCTRENQKKKVINNSETFWQVALLVVAVPGKAQNWPNLTFIFSQLFWGSGFKISIIRIQDPAFYKWLSLFLTAPKARKDQEWTTSNQEPLFPVIQKFEELLNRQIEELKTKMGRQDNFILDHRDALSIVISVVLVVLVLLCCIFHVKMKCCQRWLLVDWSRLSFHCSDHSPVLSWAWFSPLAQSCNIGKHICNLSFENSNKKKTK